MSKKSTKSQKKAKKPLKASTFVIIGSCLLAVALIAAASLLIRRHLNSLGQNSVNVGFYNLSEKTSAAIQKNIEGMGLQKTSFKNLSYAEFNSEKINKSFDLVFTSENLASENKKASCSNFSAKLYSYIPTSLRRQNEPNDRKSIPLLLDHFEFSYNKNITSKTGFENQNPQSFEDMLRFLNSSKKYAFTPFFTNGGDDEILLGLISTLIEAMAGYDAYKGFVDSAKKNPSLENLMSVKLADHAAGYEVFTLQSVLDLLRDWQEKGIVHPAWYNAKFRDILAFIEDGQVALLFTKLSLHRTIPYKLIRDFSTERAPLASVRTDHALIAPAVIALKTSKKGINDKVLQFLLSEEGQTSLSMQSQLAPVALRGESYDLQADDVRFFAASCRYGCRSDLLSAAFVKNAEGISESGKNLCESIRKYLNTGTF